MKTRTFRLTTLTLTLAAFVCGAPAHAQWTQWGGPARDFCLPGPPPAAWPDSGPKKLWSRPLGAGYTSILVDRGSLYTMYRTPDDREVVIGMSAADGTTRWEHGYEARLSEDASTDFGRGPNATPLLADGRLYTVGFTGALLALDARDGRVLWSRSLPEMNGTKLIFGYSSSPLAYKDTVILPLGGAGQAVVALDQKTGDVRWKSETFDNTYSSPVLIDVGGSPQLAVVMTKEIVGLDPQDGRLLWTHPLRNQWDTHVFTPVSLGDGKLFVSSFEQSELLQLAREGDATKVTRLWSNEKRGFGQTTAVRVDDVIVGSSGSSRAAFLTGLDAKTGAELWRTRDFKLANCVSIGPRVLVADEEGTVALVDVARTAPSVACRAADVLHSRMWTAPSVADGVAYLRDQTEILALALR